MTGRPKKEHKKIRVAVYLDSDIYEKLDKESNEKRMTKSTLTNQILKERYDHKN